MTTAAVRSAIVAKLSGIPGIGIVHDRQRFTADQGEFRAMYIEGEVLLGWHVVRKSTKETPFDTTYNKAIHRWEIRGYMALVDEASSELSFDDQVELVRDAFRDDETLGDVVETTYADGLAGLQLDDLGPVMFAGVLCHSARMTLATKCDVLINPTDPDSLDDFATGNVVFDRRSTDPEPNPEDTFELETI